MAETRQGPRLPAEPLLRAGTRRHPGVKDLERHAAPQGDLLRLVHDSHPPAAEGPEEAVVPDHHAGPGVSGRGPYDAVEGVERGQVPTEGRLEVGVLPDQRLHVHRLPLLPGGVPGGEDGGDALLLAHDRLPPSSVRTRASRARARPLSFFTASRERPIRSAASARVSPSNRVSRSTSR